MGVRDDDVSVDGGARELTVVGQRYLSAALSVNAAISTFLLLRFSLRIQRESAKHFFQSLCKLIGRTLDRNRLQAQAQ